MIFCRIIFILILQYFIQLPLFCRLKEHNEIIRNEMLHMGFELKVDNQQNPDGYFTTVFRNPKNPLFVFEEFRSRLNDYGWLISFILDQYNSILNFSIVLTT